MLVDEDTHKQVKEAKLDQIMRNTTWSMSSGGVKDMGQKNDERSRPEGIKESVDREKQLRPGSNTARIYGAYGTCGIASGAQKVLNAVQE